MKLHNPTAEIFIPDGKPQTEALRRITHLGIGAHQDDPEFMAFHGILECFANEAKRFGGVTCTNGAGNSRTDDYEKFSDAQMIGIRRQEQNAAVVTGRYGAMLQLDYPSSAVKSATDASLKNDLKQILGATSPDVVYTHIGVVMAALQAMHKLPRDQRPKRVIGCEVWRDLDWMTDADKTCQLIFRMDLTPAVEDETLDIVEYVCGYIDKFKADVRRKLSKRLGAT